MKPVVYANQTNIAAMCGVVPGAVGNWLARVTGPLVAPDAFLVNGTPLWTQENAARIAAKYRKGHVKKIRLLQEKLSNIGDDSDDAQTEVAQALVEYSGP